MGLALCSLHGRIDSLFEHPEGYEMGWLKGITFMGLEISGEFLNKCSLDPAYQSDKQSFSIIF